MLTEYVSNGPLRSYGFLAFAKKALMLKSFHLLQRCAFTLSTIPAATGIQTPVYLYLTVKPQRTDQQSKQDNRRHDNSAGRHCSTMKGRHQYCGLSPLGRYGEQACLHWSLSSAPLLRP